MAQSIESLKFDNTYCQLPETFYQPVFPTPFENAWLAALSESAAKLIDLDPQSARDPEFPKRLMGSRPLPGSWPIAQVYAGHQFGAFVPQLGDGRAILLGEACGSTASLWNPYRRLTARKWDLHLKGAGRTPFSRQFDGRAVLRSCIREFLASEALHALGIPTSRALAVIASDTPVFRESPEPGAMLLRLAPSHIRFGTFEYFSHAKRYEELQTLADFTLQIYYPHLVEAEHPYFEFFKEVTVRTAELIAHWQAFGFVHGVMNTDNFSILGFTLDFGPYGFQDEFNPQWVSNHSDTSGVYAFENQPRVGFFNLQCLMRALAPLLTREQAEEALHEYEPALARCYLGLMADKLGLLKRAPEDEVLVSDLLQLLPGTDYTRFFRELSDWNPADGEGNEPVLKSLGENRSQWNPWLARYAQRLAWEGSQAPTRARHMKASNPKYILRNYLAEQAIQKALHQDYKELETLHRVLEKPFEEQPEFESYASPSPEWGRKLNISCSS